MLLSKDLYLVMGQQQFESFRGLRLEETMRVTLQLETKVEAKTESAPNGKRVVNGQQRRRSSEACMGVWKM